MHYLLQGQLRPVSRVIKSWELGEPLDLRTPLPYDIFAAVVATAISWSWFGFAACLLLAYHCLLRPGEACMLTWGSLLIDEAGDAFYGFGIVAIEQPKTRYSAGRIQHVLITCAWTSFYLKSLINLLQPNLENHIFPSGYGTFLRRWKDFFAAMQLPALWSPAGLRAGGATFAYRCGMTIDQLRIRGRWASVAALEHYIQEATAFAVRSKLTGKLKLFVSSRAKIVWNIVLASIAELAEGKVSPCMAETRAVHPVKDYERGIQNFGTI